MADEPNAPPPGEPTVKTLKGFPPPSMPAVFADGVMSFAIGPGVIKFYLYRQDPSMTGDGDSQNQAFLQVVMSMTGFGSTVVWFDSILAQLIQSETISQKQADEWRAAVVAKAPQ